MRSAFRRGVSTNARVCVCGRVGNRRERVETVKRIKEAKKNDGCRQCRRRRRRVARGGRWRRRAKKKTDISETNDAFRASAGRSTRRSRGKTRSRARVGRTRVHSDGAVRVRDGDQVHAAERLIGAGPVQRPLRVRGRARRRDLRGEINGHLAGAGVVRVSASVPSRAPSRPITGGGCA